MTRRVIALLAVFGAGLALALAGCGGGSKKSSAATTSAAATSAAATTEAATTAAATTAAATTAAATTSAQTTAATPSFTKGKCKALAQKAQAQFSPSNIQSDPEKVAAALESFVSQVPSEIRGDVKTLADAFKKYADALKAAGFKAGTVPSADQIAKLQSAFKEIDTAKVRQAEQHLTAWAQKNCT
jgi:hypothetical protein